MTRAETTTTTTMVSSAAARDDDGEERRQRNDDDDEENRWSSSSKSLRKNKRYFSVFLMTITSAFLYADQNLLAPNLSQAAEEFGFTEREKDVKLAGWLQMAFFVVGSPASLIIGWWCDKTTRRVRLLFVTTLVGEGPCLATYWVTKYWQLFFLRAMTGIAVGGCLPLLFSLCGDLFSHKTRAKVASFLTIATGAGIAFGQIMSGAVGPKYGWKVPFVVSAAPAVFFAFLTWMLVDEPVRGGMDVKVKGNHFGHLTEEEEELDKVATKEGKKKNAKEETPEKNSNDDNSSKRDENEDIISQISASDIEIYSGKMDVQKLKRHASENERVGVHPRRVRYNPVGRFERIFCGLFTRQPRFDRRSGYRSGDFIRFRRCHWRHWRWRLGTTFVQQRQKFGGLTHGFEYHARRVAIVLLRQFDVFRAFRVSVILFVFCDWSIVLLDATERASGVGEHQPAGNSRLGVRMLLPSGRHRERSGPGIHSRFDCRF